MPHQTLNAIPSTALIISLIAFPRLSGSYVYRNLRGRNTFRASWRVLFEVLSYAIIGYAASILLLSAVSWRGQWEILATERLCTMGPSRDDSPTSVAGRELRFGTSSMHMHILYN